MKQASDSEIEVFRICWNIHVDRFCPCFRYGALRIVLAGLHEASKSCCDAPLLSYATSHAACPDLLRLEQALPEAGSGRGPVLSAWTTNMSEELANPSPCLDTNQVVEWPVNKDGRIGAVMMTCYDLFRQPTTPLTFRHSWSFLKGKRHQSRAWIFQIHLLKSCRTKFQQGHCATLDPCLWWFKRWTPQRHHKNTQIVTMQIRCVQCCAATSTDLRCWGHRLVQCQTSASGCCRVPRRDSSTGRSTDLCSCRWWIKEVDWMCRWADTCGWKRLKWFNSWIDLSMGGKDGDTFKMDSKDWELQLPSVLCELLKVARWLVNPAGEEAFCIGAPWHGLCCVECRQDPMESPEIIRLQVNDGGNCGNSVWMTRWWQATLERVFEKGSKYDLTKVSLEEVSWRVKVVKTQGMILNGAHLSGDVSLDAWDVVT